MLIKGDVIVGYLLETINLFPRYENPVSIEFLVTRFGI